jgi:hypothetical protein
MADALLSHLRTRINTMSDRIALHEDDRMVAILSGDGRRQPKHVSGLCPPRYELKAGFNRVRKRLGGHRLTFLFDAIRIVDDYSVFRSY